MDLGSDTPDPEVYPNGILVETTTLYNFNTNKDETWYTATCGWCDVWGDRPFRHSSQNQADVVRTWQNHAKIFHPARLDPKFNARTVG